MRPVGVPSYDRRAAIVLREVPAENCVRIDTAGCSITAGEIERLVAEVRPILPGTLRFESTSNDRATLFFVVTPDEGVIRGRLVLHAQVEWGKVVTVSAEVLLDERT